MHQPEILRAESRAVMNENAASPEQEAQPGKRRLPQRIARDSGEAAVWLWRRCRYGRWPLRILLGLIVVVILIGVTGYLLLCGSLPQTQGTVRLPGLDGVVTATRDSQGVPTIRATDALDAWRVLGYLEAQDRFFQMDVMRRMAAGDLAALVGPAALKLDRAHARFDLRARAERIYLDAPPAERARLVAYTLGVNEGLSALDVRPWPYLVLRTRPQPWQPSDCVLVIYAMGWMLQDPTAASKQARAALRALYPAAVTTFLSAPDTVWAAPMAGTPPKLPPIPGTQAIDLSAGPVPATRPAAASATRGAVAALSLPRPHPGSNSFAVSNYLSQSGHALLANDPHLTLRMPPTWYRARLVYPSASASAAAPITLTGVFLPGMPALVIGTNGHIAWGLTNSGGDWTDLIRVKPLVGADPKAAPTYATPAGTATLSLQRDLIAVRGKPAKLFITRHTIWGPVIGTTTGGALLVSHWALAQPGGVNLDFMRLDSLTTVKQALALAAHAGIPAQNFLVVDARGHIGWTIAGRIPARKAGCDYSVPQSWSDGSCGWTGWLAPDEYPRIVDPPQGYLVTANNRVDAREPAELALGNEGFADGARAHQITGDLHDLAQRGNITARDLQKVQLDDRAIFLTRWRDLLLKVLSPSTLDFHPRRSALRAAVVGWGARAAIDSTGYRLVRLFRSEVVQSVFAPELKRLHTLDPGARLPFSDQIEGPLWRLVTARPRNWLNPDYPTWNALFLHAVDAVIHRLWRTGAGFSAATWGARNTVRIDQPLAGALGPLGRWLKMPPTPLPGDTNMPRVQTPDFGASMRMVVSPLPEAPGLFELPGGESSNPLSPWYGDEFRAWAEGMPTPLAPGAAVKTLTFMPWSRMVPTTVAVPAGSSVPVPSGS